MIFTNDGKIVDAMRSEIFYTGGIEQDVMLINEKSIVSKHMKDTSAKFEIERPTTAVVGYK